MTFAPTLLVVSNVRYRLSDSGSGKLIEFKSGPIASAAAKPKAGLAVDQFLNSILERTRRSAEARSLMSRYFSF